MAQRLATEYKNVTLSLALEELTEFIRLFRMNNARVEERVLDQGDYELTLYDQNEQVKLYFEKRGDKYHLTGSCFFRDRQLADIMRKAMASFKGKAVVYRIFQSFIVEYCYELGTVKSIREISETRNDVIFENNDFSFYLQKIFANQEVEQKISQFREAIDMLLDQRLRYHSRNCKLEEIDQHLNQYVKKLHQLEA